MCVLEMGKKECWEAEERKGRSQARLPELDTAEMEPLLMSSVRLACCPAVVPEDFLLLPLRSRSLSPSLSRSEPDAVPVVVSRSVPLVVLTSSRSLPSERSAIHSSAALSISSKRAHPLCSSFHQSLI